MFDKTLLEQFKTNRQERNGILSLILVMIIIFLTGKLFWKNEIKQEQTDQKLIELLDEYYKSKEEEKPVEKPKVKTTTTTTQKRNKQDGIETPSKIILFPFNPNTVTFTELKTLGFNAKQANTLIKFRKSGFVFETSDDLSEVYGLDKELLDKLFEYVQIPQNKIVLSVPNKKDSIVLKSSTPKLSQKKIEINKATREDLISIYSIGNIYSKIILKFRDSLGGFFNLTQISEAYDFPDSTLLLLHEALIIDTSTIDKLNINQVTFKELLAHPYISYEQNQILYPFIESRRPIKDLRFLDDILLIDSATIKKVKPYLSAQ